MTIATNQEQSCDYTLLINKARTMMKHDEGSKQSRWEDVIDAIDGLVSEIVTRDDDGITLYTFSGNFKRHNNIQRVNQVTGIIAREYPQGGHRLSEVLTAALDDYLARRQAGTAKAGGEKFVLVTDGEPQEPDRLAEVIATATKSARNATELGITIIQVGDDPWASKYYDKLHKVVEEKLAKSGTAPSYRILKTVSAEAMKDENLEDLLKAPLQR